MSLFLVDSAKEERRAQVERNYEHREDHLNRDGLALPPPIIATEEMCAFCFDVIISTLGGTPDPHDGFLAGVSCPFFVTWDKVNSGGRALRGCIGTLSSRPLTSLKDFARSSAFRDTRFSPITMQEVSGLMCSVSLLVQYEEAENLEDWVVGVHGILIAFTDKNGSSYSATYLPEVARDQGWSQDEALTSLVRKAGYRGKVTPALRAGITLTRYQSSKARLSYDAYRAMQEEV